MLLWSEFHWQCLITYIFSVSLKFGACYITGQLDKFRVKNASLRLHTFWLFFLFFIKKTCVFIIFISFFDEVLNFCNRIFTNQKPELVIRHCQWKCMYKSSIYWRGILSTLSNFEQLLAVKYFPGRRNEKDSGGLRVYQKILARLVSWLKRSCNWNRLKCPETLNRVVLGNANSQYKYIFVKYVEPALKAFKDFNWLRVWGLGEGFWCFIINCSLSSS